MNSTNQRKRVVCLAVAFLAVGVLAANVEARPRGNNGRKAKAQQRDHGRQSSRNRGRHHRDRGRHHRDRDRSDSRWSIGLNLGTGHVRTVPHARIGGHIELRWVAPVYKTRWDGCGRKYQVLIRKGYWEEVWVPGRVVFSHRNCKRHCGAGCHIAAPVISVRGSFRF